MVPISLRCCYGPNKSEDYGSSARMHMRPLKGETTTRINGTGAEAGDVHVVSCLARYRRSEAFLRTDESPQTRNRMT